MMNLPKVKDFFPIMNGVVSHINYDFQYITKEQLDILFISNYGECTISPIASQLAVGDSPTEETLNNSKPLPTLGNINNSKKADYDIL